MKSRAAFAIVALWAATAGAAGLPALEPDERRRLERGETILHERPVANYSWPEIVAYRRSAASASAVMAVYAQFGTHAEYIPGIVRSDVLAREASNAFRILYEHEVAGPNERYTVIMHVTRVDDGWDARWSLVTARYARRLEGGLRVLARADGSLLVYRSRVDPGLLGVTFGTPSSVATGVAQTTQAVAMRAEGLAASDPARLASLIEALEALVRRGP